MYSQPYASYKHLPPLNLPHYQPSLPMLSLYNNPRNLCFSNDQLSKQYQNQNIDDRFPKQQQSARYNSIDQVEGKSFIDTFDNNTSGLLNQNKSFARNIQGRLLNNTLDHDVQRAKQQKLSDYRMSLKKQMEEVRERKRVQKQKIDRQEMERERKFYQECKNNEMQEKQANGDNLNMGKTLNKLKKFTQNHTSNFEEQSTSNHIKSISTPLKPRGKNYLNKSSLDTHNFNSNFNSSRKIAADAHSEYQNFKTQPSRTERAEIIRYENEIIRDQIYEQQRISRLIASQQRILQKISEIKGQIKKTANVDDHQKELTRIRNCLRMKPIPFFNNLIEHEENVKKENFLLDQFYNLTSKQLHHPFIKKEKAKSELVQDQISISENSRQNQISDYHQSEKSKPLFIQKEQLKQKQKSQSQSSTKTKTKTKAKQNPKSNPKSQLKQSKTENEISKSSSSSSSSSSKSSSSSSSSKSEKQKSNRKKQKNIFEKDESEYSS